MAGKLWEGIIKERKTQRATWEVVWDLVLLYQVTQWKAGEMIVVVNWEGKQSVLYWLTRQPVILQDEAPEKILFSKVVHELTKLIYECNERTNRQ